MASGGPRRVSRRSSPRHVAGLREPGRPAPAGRLRADPESDRAGGLRGPRLGHGPSTGDPGLIQELTERIEAPLVIDADGLSARGPHRGAGRPAGAIGAHRTRARWAGRSTGSPRQSQRSASRARGKRQTGRRIVLLKGDDSIVTDGERLPSTASEPEPATADRRRALRDDRGPDRARGRTVRRHLRRGGRPFAGREGRWRPGWSRLGDRRRRHRVDPGRAGALSAEVTGGRWRCRRRRDRAELPDPEGTVGDGTELCAVVKANGYGHGAAVCAAAALRGGATRLAVAAATEAEELRLHFPDAPILVMGALTLASSDGGGRPRGRRALARGLPGALLEARGRARPDDAGTPQVRQRHGEAGRARSGQADRARAAPAKTTSDSRSRASGPISPRPTSRTTPSWPSSSRPSRRWRRRSRELAPECTVHAANSAATLRDPATHFDMVRCGIAVYGLDPFKRDPAEHEPSRRSSCTPTSPT